MEKSGSLMYRISTDWKVSSNMLSGERACCVEVVQKLRKCSGRVVGVGLQMLGALKRFI